MRMKSVRQRAVRMVALALRLPVKLVTLWLNACALMDSQDLIVAWMIYSFKHVLTLLA